MSLAGWSRMSCPRGSARASLSTIAAAPASPLTDPSGRAPRQGQPDAATDQRHAGEPAEQLGAPRGHEPRPPQPGGDRPAGVTQRGSDDRNRAHHGKLPIDRQGRIDELRQESREERDRLRVRQRDRKAAPDMHMSARRGRGGTLAGTAPSLNAEPDQVGRATQRRISNSTAAYLTTKLRPNAMAATRMALPSVVPMTVMSAARMPWLAPVAMTSVTIGPGVITMIDVISRNAANSSQFISTSACCVGRSTDFRTFDVPGTALETLAQRFDPRRILEIGRASC